MKNNVRSNFGCLDIEEETEKWQTYPEEKEKIVLLHLYACRLNKRRTMSKEIAL